MDRDDLEQRFGLIDIEAAEQDALMPRLSPQVGQDLDEWLVGNDGFFVAAAEEDVHGRRRGPRRIPRRPAASYRYPVPRQPG